MVYNPMFVLILFLGLAFKPALAQDAVVDAGGSANLVVVSKEKPKQVLPGFGFRTRAVTGGDADEGSAIGRGAFEYFRGWRSDGKDARTNQALQARVGGGIFDFGDSKVYYMLMSDFNFDSTSKNGVERSASIWVNGGEVGRKFGGDENVLYLGANTGVGWIRGLDENHPKQPTSGPSDAREFTRSTFAAGWSASGRFGEANERGTISIESSGTKLVGEGSRGNFHGGVNLSKYISLGGGVRWVNIKDAVGGYIRDVVPFLRLTLGGQGVVE